jgi:predicted DNA-binding ribbon-helix-helix protein
MRRFGPHRKSTVFKRSVWVADRQTSVSLEAAFWLSLKEIASMHDMTLSELMTTIDSERQHGNLSSAIRLFVLEFYRRQISVSKPPDTAKTGFDSSSG